MASGPWRLCIVRECDPGCPILQGRVLLSLQRHEWRDWHLFQQEKKNRKQILPCPAWMPPEWKVRRCESGMERGREGGPEHSK